MTNAFEFREGHGYLNIIDINDKMVVDRDAPLKCDDIDEDAAWKVLEISGTGWNGEEEQNERHLPSQQATGREQALSPLALRDGSQDAQGICVCRPIIYKISLMTPIPSSENNVAGFIQISGFYVRSLSRIWGSLPARQTGIKFSK